MLDIWHRLLEALISLLVPPLSDRPSSTRAPGPAEVNIIFKWLAFLKSFFNASENGSEYGVPLGQLQSGGYRDLLMLGQYLDLPGPALKERCSAAVKALGLGGQGANPGMKEDQRRTAEVLLRLVRTR